MNRIFFGHHKCASTWMTGIFYDFQKYSGLKINYGIDNSNDINILNNANTSNLNEYKNFKAIHLIRDPRDIVISGYYSHLKTHESSGWDRLIEHRKVLKRSTFKEGLIHEIDWLEPYFHDIENWDFSNKNVLELKFEEITKEIDLIKILKHLDFYDNSYLNLIKYPFKMIINKLHNKKILYFNFKNIKLTKRVAKKITQRNTFKAVSGGRNKGIENLNSHYRKGISGEWKEVFDDELKEIFKKKYPNILLKTGYEKDNNW